MAYVRQESNLHALLWAPESESGTSPKFRHGRSTPPVILAGSTNPLVNKLNRLGHVSKLPCLSAHSLVRSAGLEPARPESGTRV
jgi:hypothetical protein